MRSFSYFLFAFLITFFVGLWSAHAETVSSISNTETAITQYGVLTEADACDNIPSTVAGYYDQATAKINQDAQFPQKCGSGQIQRTGSSSLSTSGIYNFSFYNTTNGSSGNWSYALPTRQYCPSFNKAPPCVQYSCPAGGYAISSDGMSCSRPDCPAGATRNSGGDCVTPCPPVGDKLHYGQLATWSSSLANPGAACINGCQYLFATKFATCIDSTCGRIVGPSTNLSCGATDIIPIQLTSADPTDPTKTPTTVPNNPTAPGTNGAQSSPPPATTEAQCAAKGMGYITMNGVTICVQNGTGQEKSSTSVTDSKTNADGSSSSSTKTTTKNADGTVSESTTTTNKDPAGNVTGTTTTSTTSGNLDSYCQLNPNASICKQASYSGGGDCTTAPTCSGDPIGCANVYQTWKARCEVNKQNTFTSTKGAVQGSFPSLDSDVQAAKDALSQRFAEIRQQATTLISFNSSGVGSLGCPTDDVAIGSHTAHLALCFNKYEGQLSSIGSVVVFIATLIALFIVFS